MRLVGRVEDNQNEHRRVDVPEHAADVVARALVHDLRRLLRGRFLLARIEKQLQQTIAAVVHGLAVDLVNIAKLPVAVRLALSLEGGRSDELAMRHGGRSDLSTDVMLFSDHAEITCW